MRNSKVKVVVDTNVFIYGTIPSILNKYDSDTIDILSRLLNMDKIELVFSQDTIGELIYITKNIVKHCIKDINKQELYMCKIVLLFLEGYSVNVSHTKAPRCSDPNDNMFLKGIRPHSRDFSHELGR